MAFFKHEAAASSLIMKACTYCGLENHTRFLCPYRPRPSMKRSWIKQIGPVANKWIKTREQWFIANKAPYYFCYYCGKQMTKTQLTLDHKQSRSRRPDLRFSVKNLVPCCADCNIKKGSKSAEEFMK